MDDYLNGIDEDLWRCFKSGNYRLVMLEEIDTEILLMIWLYEKVNRKKMRRNLMVNYVVLFLQ